MNCEVPLNEFCNSRLAWLTYNEYVFKKTKNKKNAFATQTTDRSKPLLIKPTESPLCEYDYTTSHTAKGKE